MSKRLRPAAMFALAVALLAGCGGSSDEAVPGAPASDPPPDIQRYANVDWRGCAPTATGSRLRHLTITPHDEHPVPTGVYLDTWFEYTTPDCSGRSVNWDNSSGLMYFMGPKTFGAGTADKVIIAPGDSLLSTQQVYLLSGTGPVTLTAGRLEGPMDQFGYPAVLEDWSYVRQGDAIRKYVGTWTGCIRDGNYFRGESLQFSMGSNTSARLKWGVAYYVTEDCNDNADVSYFEAGFLLQGTKMIGADTVDLVILSLDAPAPERKQVFLVRPTEPGVLWYGDTSALDANGYPARLGPLRLTRQ